MTGAHTCLGRWTRAKFRTRQLLTPDPLSHASSLFFPPVSQTTRLKSAKETATRVQEELARSERAPSALGVPTPLPEDLLPAADASDIGDDSLEVLTTTLPTSPAHIEFAIDLELIKK